MSITETETTNTFVKPMDIEPGHASTRHKLGNPWAYFKKCLRLYADGHGRASRAEYWSFALMQFVLLIPFFLLMFADLAASDGEDPGALFIVGLVGLVVVSLGLTIPAICVAIRRLHDIGLSGWLFLLQLVPYVGGLFMFVCSLIPSSDKTNEHGPSPKADLSETFA